MRRVVLAVVATAAGLVLLLSFKSHSLVAATPTVAVAPKTTPGGPAGAAPGSTFTATTGATRTVTGQAVGTLYGPVQVQITVTGKRITGITVLQQPTGSPRDQEINSYALPQLTQEALAAQSAQIDAVSGATYTSQGYIQSLQSALDRARV